MRKLFALIILYLLSVHFSYSQWFTQYSGTVMPLGSVDFVNSETGYIAGYGIILKTTNGGENWVSASFPGSNNFIKFVNTNTGFIASDSGRIFKTTNSGMNWSLTITPANNYFSSMDFFDENTGIAAGPNKSAAKTTDGGNTWFNINNFIWQIDLLSCQVINSQTYFVSGNNTFILKTTNGGQTWREYTHGEFNPLFTICFINENTGFTTGCCGMFMTTTNGGNNWSNNYFLSPGFSFYSMKFLNQLTGFVSGDNGMIYRTTNGGLWWDSTGSGTNQSLYSIKMINDATGWAVGNYGTILKTTNGGGQGFTIGINTVSNEVPGAFELSQNYPNPFNPQTKIKFTIPHAGYVKIRIFNEAGKELEKLYSGNLNAGIFEVNFDAVKYPSGVYFYMAEFEGTALTKKMILVK